MRVSSGILLTGSMALLGFLGCADGHTDGSEDRREGTSIRSLTGETQSPYLRFETSVEDPDLITPRSFDAANEYATRDDRGRWYVQGHNDAVVGTPWVQINTARASGTVHCDSTHYVQDIVYTQSVGAQWFSRNNDCEITVSAIDDVSGLVQGTAHGTLQHGGKSVPFFVEFAVPDLSVEATGSAE